MAKREEFVATVSAVNRKFNSVLFSKSDSSQVWLKLDRLKDLDVDSFKKGEKYRLVVEDRFIVSAERVDEAEPEASVWDFKDWRITRLAAVERAISFLAQTKGSDFSLEDVFEAAEKICDFAYRGRPPLKQ